MQKSAENVKKGVFDDGGHDGGVRIYLLSRVTAGSRHEMCLKAHRGSVRCRKVLKTRSKGYLIMADTMASLKFAF